jgi:hypothetical protein
MKTLIFTIRIITVMLIFFSFGVIVSCKEESKKKDPTTNSTKITAPNTSEDNASGAIGDIAINPAHGLPGHRCDIPVGAPLNSLPTKNNNNTKSGSPVINSAEVKLNPAHGQPGHRCDINVGDPL